MSSPQPQLMMSRTHTAPQPATHSLQIMMNRPQTTPQPAPQPHQLMMNRPQTAPQPQPQPAPQPQPQLQMCLLKYNYCECKGCDKDFAKFQKLVVEKYKVPNPSLDKQHRIVTVMGTSDATGLTKLLKKATGKKHVDILPNPVMEASEAEKRNKDNNKSQEEANRPQQQQQHQPPPDATNLGERGIGGRTSGNMHNVGESSAMGQMEQRQQYSRVNNNQESAWNYFNDENSNSCTICESGAKLAS